MCWNGLKSDKRIAEKDITVYKVLNVLKRNGEKPQYISPFLKTPYVFGKLYSECLNINYFTRGSSGYNNGEGIFIDRGIHCFDGEVYVVKMPSVFPNPSKNLMFKVTNKHNIFDTMWSFYPEFMTCEETLMHIARIPVVVKCTIPEGATYYVNKRGAIVTTKIRFEKDLGQPKVNIIIHNMENGVNAIR